MNGQMIVGLVLIAAGILFIVVLALLGGRLTNISGASFLENGGEWS